jgi:PTS system cellobiose-specific IIC component
MHWNVINKPFVNVPWTTPPIIGHYLVSGGDWRAAAWGLLSIVIAMCIYFPFAKAAERQRQATTTPLQRKDAETQRREETK